MIMSDVNDDTLKEMDTLVAEGVPDFKLFTAYPGVFYSDDGAIFRAMQQTGKNGGLIMMHAENGMAIDIVAADLVADGKTDPLYHGIARYPVFEGEATNRVIRLAEAAQVPVYIVHLSARDALNAVRDARDRGSQAFAETCPQYLFLSLDDMGNGFEGAKFICSPPLRTADHQDELWTGLIKDDLQVVSTDHCPFDFHGQKDLGKGDFRKVPNGLPGVEDRLDLLHDGGVVGGQAHEGALGRDRLDGTGEALRDVPEEGLDHGRRRRRPRDLRPEPQAHHLGEDAPHGRRLLVLRGSRGPGRQRRRDEPRLRGGQERRVHREEGRRPVHQALHRRLRADGLTGMARESPAEVRRLRMASDVDNLAAARAFVRDAVADFGGSQRVAEDLVQAVDEATCNVMLHGYGHEPGEIDLEAQVRDGKIEIRLLDRATPFDPTSAPKLDTSRPPVSKRPERWASGFISSVR